MLLTSCGTMEQRICTDLDLKAWYVIWCNLNVHWFANSLVVTKCYYFISCKLAVSTLSTVISFLPLQADLKVISDAKGGTFYRDHLPLLGISVWIINPLHPIISMHILHTALYTCLKVLNRRICLTVKSSLVVDHFLYSYNLNVWFMGDIIRRN